MRTFALALLIAGPALAQEEVGAPLSAIDWLSQSVESATVSAPGPLFVDEAPVSETATSPEVTVMPLDAPTPDRVGLLSPDQTGLPRSLWAGSSEEMLIDLIRTERVETLPAMQALLTTLMLAEADPPTGAGPEGRLFLARVDKLLDLGAIDPAQSLLDAAVPESPALFRRYFDVALLAGTEDRACRLMDRKPEVAPTLPARIFCLARGGDWSAAALTLNTARALGDVDEDTDALLSRFLDPELFEGEAALPAPERPSPLVFRMREAIGEGLSTRTLPRAFAHADLRPNAGWKAQLEAAERLARTGAVADATLLDLYTAQRPAASGGVWDRAEAIQRLDTALTDGNARAVGRTLPVAAEAMRRAGLDVPFARLFGPRLAEIALPDAVAPVAFRIALLAPGYEEAALDYDPRSDEERFLKAVARGDLSEMPASTIRQEAIRAAFTDAPAPPRLMAQARNGRLGEALLRTIALMETGASGDLATLTDALAFLRAAGLEDYARRAALQVLLLETGS